MGVTLTDVLLFGKAQSDDVDNASFVIYRRNMLRWSALGGYLDIIVKGVAPLSLPDAIADSLSYVKAFGGTEQRNLPAEYVENQFIYMLDGSYLTTDIVPTFAGHYELEMQTTSVTTNAATYLGGRNESSGNGGLRFAHMSDKTFIISGFGAISASSGTAADNTKYKFIWDNGSFWVYSGTTLIHSGTFTEETMPTTTPLTINGRNSGGTIGGNTEGIYLYSFKAWNAQGELIADYVPATLLNPLTVGIYDRVTGTHLTPTSGTWSAGPALQAPTPDTPMDIVSNNGALKYSFNMANVNAQTALVGYYISASGVVTADANNWIYQDYIPVSPNTTYTLTMSSSVYYVTISEYSTADDSGFIRRNAGGSGDNTTLTITTGSTTNFIRFGTNIDRTEVTLEEVLAINWQLNKGNSMPYTPYSPTGIYTDGTVETINAHGKNLFDKNDIYKDNYSINSSGVETSSTGFCIIKASVLPSTSYTWSCSNGTYTLRIHAYDKNGNWISQLSAASTSQTATVTTTSNTYEIRFSINKTTDNLNNGQLERGSTATTYVPYYDGGTATAEMLLKVGDYQDVQSIIDGAITRNVGVRVLDGTESWSVATTNVLQSDILPNDAYGQTCICSHLEYTTSSTLSGMPENSLRNGSATYKNRLYVKSSTLATDATTWTNYLKAQYTAGTPVIVLYPLATPTTESVAGQTLQVTDGDNVLEITQAGLNGLELEAKYQAAVSLTIQEVQDANLDPNVQVTIN